MLLVVTLAYIAAAIAFYSLCVSRSVLAVESTKEAEIIHLFPASERIAA